MSAIDRIFSRRRISAFAQYRRHLCDRQWRLAGSRDRNVAAKTRFAIRIDQAL